MKTLKTSAVDQPKKSSETVRTVRSSKVTTGKAIPTEEQIRSKAFEIYTRRIESGRYATESDDWIEAERLLREL